MPANAFAGVALFSTFYPTALPIGKHFMLISPSDTNKNGCFSVSGWDVYRNTRQLNSEAEVSMLHANKLICRSPLLGETCPKFKS